MGKEVQLRYYRGPCNSLADVRGYNRVTHGIYCIPCARAIHKFSPDLNLFPLLDLEQPEGGCYVGGIIVVRM